jgi:hypothetical protein
MNHRLRKHPAKKVEEENLLSAVMKVGGRSGYWKAMMESREHF